VVVNNTWPAEFPEFPEESPRSSVWGNEETLTLDDQYTGSSVVSQPFIPPAGMGLAERVARERALTDYSETESCTETLETPRDGPPPAYADLVGAETLIISLDVMRMRGIQRLAEPFFTVFVVDKDGAALCHEQTTPPLQNIDGDFESMKVDHVLSLQIPGGERANGCAVIMKLRQQKTQGSVTAPATRCWTFLPLERLVAGRA